MCLYLSLNERAVTDKIEETLLTGCPPHKNIILHSLFFHPAIQFITGKANQLLNKRG